MCAQFFRRESEEEAKILAEADEHIKQQVVVSCHDLCVFEQHLSYDKSVRRLAEVIRARNPHVVLLQEFRLISKKAVDRLHHLRHGECLEVKGWVKGSGCLPKGMPPPGYDLAALYRAETGWAGMYATTEEETAATDETISWLANVVFVRKGIPFEVIDMLDLHLSQNLNGNNFGGVEINGSSAPVPRGIACAKVYAPSVGCMLVSSGH